MEDFFDRLDKYMKYNDLNDNQVTVKAGLSVGALGKQRKGSRGLSSDSIAKLLLSYSDLSASWLLTGRGEMLSHYQDNVVYEHPTSYNKHCDRCKMKDELITSLNREIETLQKLIAHLDKDQGNNNPANNTKHPCI